MFGYLLSQPEICGLIFSTGLTKLKSIKRGWEDPALVSFPTHFIIVSNMTVLNLD